MTGSGTQTDPYLVATLSDLNSISSYFPVNDYIYFKQTADIDIGSGFTPVGETPDVDISYLYYFIYDGDNYQLRNGTISGSYGTAIFKSCYMIKNIKSSNIQVTGNYFNAIIVSFCHRLVFGCSTDSLCSLNCSNDASGIVSDTSQGSEIKYCSNEAVVTSTGYSAGICFYHVGYSVNNCYNSGAITGVTAYGLVYRNYFGGYIEKCYNSGVITSTDGAAGGLQGVLSTVGPVYIRNCYNLCTGIDITVSGGGGTLPDYSRTKLAIRDAVHSFYSNYGLDTMTLTYNGSSYTYLYNTINDASGEDITLSNAKLKSSYENNGWNMINIWDIDEGVGFPFLRSPIPEFLGCYMYNGVSWDSITPKVYNGVSWDNIYAKKYDGTGWN